MERRAKAQWCEKCFMYDIYSQPIHILYKWYWHNCFFYNNTIYQIKYISTQPAPSPTNMWLWIQAPVQYPQVRECRLTPVHPWCAPIHESAPLWELHLRWPRTREGPVSLFWAYCIGTSLQNILGYDQELQWQKERLWWQESKLQGCCLLTWC